MCVFTCILVLVLISPYTQQCANTFGIKTNKHQCDKQEKAFSALNYFEEVIKNDGLESEGCTDKDDLIHLRSKTKNLLDNLYNYGCQYL